MKEQGTQNALEWVLGEEDVASEAAQATSAALHFARVESSPSPDVYVLSVKGAVVGRGNRAPRCLLEPRIGDRVVIAKEGQEIFVLAVLARATTGASVVSVDGDLQLRAKDGSVGIVGERDVEISSAEGITFSAPTVTLRSLAAQFVSEAVSIVGRTLETDLDKVRVVARTVDSTLERLRQTMKRSYKTVEEVDHTKAKQIVVTAEGNATIHADNTLITADKFVKLNGDQVHIA